MKRYAVTVVIEVVYNNETPVEDIEHAVKYSYLRESALNQYYREVSNVVSIDEITE